MTQHHYQARPEASCRKFHTAYLGRRHDVSRHTDNKEIPKALVEYDLRRDPGIRATQNNCKGLLLIRQFATVHLSGAYLVAANVRDESPISVTQSFQCFKC